MSTTKGMTTVPTVSYEVMKKQMATQAAEITALKNAKPQGNGHDTTNPELVAELERLRQENAERQAREAELQGRLDEALKAKGQGRGVSMKVSEKKAVSVYGLQRMPVTLYKEQWIKLLDMTDDIRGFMADHDSELKSKADKK